MTQAFDLDAFREALADDSYCLEDKTLFECVQEGSWEQDAKYQFREDVYRHIPTNRFLSVSQSRTGSYHSDWHYEDDERCEVFPHTRTITVTDYKVTP